MAPDATEDLLAKLAGRGTDQQDTSVWAAVAATPPDHDNDAGAPVFSDAEEREGKLDELLDQLKQLDDTDLGREPVESPPSLDDEPFLPIEPRSFDEAKLTQSEIEILVLKLLLARGDLNGHTIADQIKLPFRMLDGLLLSMKHDQMVVHKGAAPMNDYIYQLTELGRELAQLHARHCTYFGSATVDLEDYIESVRAQSLIKQRPSLDDLKRAFSDLMINPRMLHRIGPAINSGRGMFLFGFPGNGKTSIAERLTLAFGDTIWIPRAIGVCGEVIRVYDPNHHHQRPLPKSHGLLDQQRIDQRWIRIARPTIVSGGELTMDSLEVTTNRMTGVSEAPLQLKSNCGTLVIDDFGRQRMSTDELLNRWIVPLEKNFDYLNLANGNKIQVPFDQLIVFSTNLEPRELVDAAFLRRVPYKIEVIDPTEQEFRDLFRAMAEKLNVVYHEEVVDYVITEHYQRLERPFRYCQPRDLLMQIANYCRFVDAKPEMTRETMDLAVENYFAVM